MDNDGTRQVRLLFEQGTTATMVFENGTELPVPQPMHVRATEFTVGADGPKAMPAELPATSAYTYAVELDVVEAAGAVRVDFDSPVIFYLENFLPSDGPEPGLPVGIPVPTGYYDRAAGIWLPSEDGRIVKIIDFDLNNRANLDTDGDGMIDNDPALGITDEERAHLDPGRYSAGQTLWRVPISHFTPYDCNFPYVPPEDAIEPTEEPENTQPETCVNTQPGSRIECQNQILGESVPVTGTPFRLHYGSDRVPGRRSAYTIQIPLTGSTVPGTLNRVELEVAVAGRLYEMTVDTPTPNLSTSFTWDGTDGYDRLLQGTQSALIRVGYAYNGVYAEPDTFGQSFARFSGVSLLLNRTRVELMLQRSWRLPIGAWDARAVGLGGWTVNVHHTYEPTGGVVHFGDGTQLRTQLRDQVIDTVVGTGEVGGDNGDNGPAVLAKLNDPRGVAIAPDGTYYTADTSNLVIRRVSPEGIIATVAGNGNFGSPIPGMSATSQPLRTLLGVGVGPDGSVYFCDDGNNRVYRVAADGILEVVAGNGSFIFSGDGGQATAAGLPSPIDVAVGSDGSVYIADWGSQPNVSARVRRVAPDGIITTVAGNGSSIASGDGGPATEAGIGQPEGIALGPDGSLYITDTSNHVVRRVGPDGIIRTVAGIAGQSGFSPGGIPATETLLDFPTRVAVDREGALFIADSANRVVRRVAPSGIATIVAGQGGSGFDGDGGPATAAFVRQLSGVAVTPDGGLLVTDRGNDRIRKVFAPTRDLSLIPSRDGTQIYVFDDQGRHQETRHALTGAILLSFHYDDTSNLLDTITDGDGKVTTIQHDASDAPTAIFAPFGQKTTLSVNGEGFLSFIRNPAAEQVDLVYSSTNPGLLKQMTDARNNSYFFMYDEDGYLERDDDPAGGFKSLDRTEIPNGYQVTLTTKLGRATSYEVVNALDGNQVRTNTDPAGLGTGVEIGSNGETIRTTPDGMKFTTTEIGDSRFGMLAPVLASQTIETPLEEKTLSITTTRVATPLDDPLNLVKLVDTVVVNGREFKSQFDAGSPSTVTTTTDVLRQTISSLDSQGRITKTEAIGTNPVLYPIRREYDGQGRVSFIKHGPDVFPEASETRITAFTYKSNAGNQTGLLDKITDATGREIQFDYDGAGRVTTQTFLPGTADQRQIVYTYDDNGNLTSLTLPDQPNQPVHGFDYTEVNLEKEYNPPQVGVVDPKTTYIYNDDRQLDDIFRPDGQTIDFDYEPTGGRLRTVTIPSATGPGNEVRTYTYHSSTGNLQTLTGPDATLTFGYDGSLLTSEEWSDGTITSTVTRTYDNDFRLDTLRVNSETPIQFGYDGDSLLTKAGALDPINRHADYGFVIDTTIGTITDAFTYTAFGELETYAASTGGGPVYEFAITERDKLGRIETKVETIGGVTTTYEYAYDPAGRLSDVFENSQHVAHYDYDSNGNRTGGFNAASGQIIGSGIVYDDQDRLESYETALGGAVSFTYNDNGDLIEKAEGSDITTYTYDALGNLRRVVLHEGEPNEKVIEYLADGRNRRIGKKEDGSVAQRFVYRDQLNPVAELDDTGNLVAQFVYGTRPNVPDYMIKNGDTYRIISDHLGSPRLVVDVATGNVAQRMDFDEFGNVVNDNAPGFQPFGFAGGLYDADTGLVRFGVRDYDPATGRWTSKDSVRFSGGQANLYQYAGNDPINYFDQRGEGIASALAVLSGCGVIETAGRLLSAVGNFPLIQSLGQNLEQQRNLLAIAEDRLANTDPCDEERIAEIRDLIGRINGHIADLDAQIGQLYFGESPLGIAGWGVCITAAVAAYYFGPV